MDKIKCPHCSKEYSKKGIGTHIWRTHGNGQKHDPNIGFKDNTKKRAAWNKGLKTPEEVKRKQSITKTGENNNFYGKHHSKETIEKLKQNAGGYRKGSGRGKSGWYQGYWCDSSWELAFVIYNLEHNIPFARNTEGFEYEFEDIKHKYYPDFMMEDGSYIEIKGYETEQTLAKYIAFPYKLLVLKLKDLKNIFGYVNEKYGNDFIRLYEMREDSLRGL